MAVLGDKQLNRPGRVEKTELVLPNCQTKYKRHILPFVPALDIKECQKLINISEIGVCVCVWQACSVPGAWSFYSLRETGAGELKEGFISKIAFSILDLLETLSGRISHVITHHVR